MSLLIQQCNADVFAALLIYKEEYPVVGEKLLQCLQTKEHLYELTYIELLELYLALPEKIWNGKLQHLNLLFQSKQITQCHEPASC